MNGGAGHETRFVLQRSHNAMYAKLYIGAGGGFHTGFFQKLGENQLPPGNSAYFQCVYPCNTCADSGLLYGSLAINGRGCGQCICYVCIC